MPARRRRARTGTADRGGATAEFAVALPALMLMTTFAFGAVDAVLDKVRCVDAARDAALVAARGGDGVAAGAARAPSGATVVVIFDATTVRAVVTLRLAPLGTRTGLTVSATAVATIEPDVAGP